MKIAILLAAGKSTRAGQDKLWADVFGRPLWTLAYDTLRREVGRVIVVVRAGQEERFLPFVDDSTLIVTGGATRMESFKHGLEAAGELTADDIVIDHNAASPNVSPQEISAVLAAAHTHGAAAVCHEVIDTLVELKGSHKEPKTREGFRLMQTPQAVRGDLLQEIASILPNSTDLSTALLANGIDVQLLPASPRNKKITTAEDLTVFAARPYLGEDSHRFSKEGQLTLGGLTIPEIPAMQANSDGDVILHAIGRALAQAQGRSFSETADALCEAGTHDSRIYLAPLLEGLQIAQVSLTLEGARPRVDPLLPQLKSSLAGILKTEESKIYISAHSGEDLSPFGLGEGLRCLALVTLFQ